ncbi:MAG: hypothetical protein ACLFPX_06985 [Candidatus Omnitrophota bacterium]
MINQLANKHPGLSAAIVASGPSALSFRPGDCHISIAVNGAAFLSGQPPQEHRSWLSWIRPALSIGKQYPAPSVITTTNSFLFDYFLCGDLSSPMREWFRIPCSRSRLIFKRIAPMDYFLYPQRTPIPRKILSYRKLKKRPLPPPVSPHLTYDYSFDDSTYFEGAKDFNKLTAGGTIAAMAVQVAFLMGCTLIRLYGCSFSLSTSRRSGHYFYTAGSSHIGWIEASMKDQMERVLKIARRHGVKIEIVGETNLTEYDALINIDKLSGDPLND